MILGFVSERLTLEHYGTIAQLVEHQTENLGVGSSNLPCTTPPIGHSND